MMRFLLFVYAVCGFSAQIHEKVLICGVCRDIAPYLKRMKPIMESIGHLFDDYRILIYENNSTDQTPNTLLAWAKRNPRIWIKSEIVSQKELQENAVNIHANGGVFRPEQIARARNIVLEEALSPVYHDFLYLIWIDMDFVRAPNLEGFIDVFQHPVEWDAVFAHGITPNHLYWDWYAFRDANNPLGPELLGGEWYNMEDERHQTFHFTENALWHPVYSAFGGCGIYKKSSIQGCRYSAVVTPDLELHIKELMKKNRHHPHIMKYLDLNRNLESIHFIEEAHPHLPPLSPHAGIILNRDPEALIWRMNTFTYQYPSVCEHVPFHASMIVRGHDKLYINPKLVFRYGN